MIITFCSPINGSLAVAKRWQIRRHDLVPRRSPLGSSISWFRIMKEQNCPRSYTRRVYQGCPCRLQILALRICWYRRGLQKECQPHDFIHFLGRPPMLHLHKRPEYICLLISQDSTCIPQLLEKLLCQILGFVAPVLVSFARIDGPIRRLDHR